MLVNTSSVIDTATGETPSPVVQGFAASVDAVANSVSENVQSVTENSENVQPSGELKQIDDQKFWAEMRLVSVMNGLETQRHELEVDLAEAKEKLASAEEALSTERAAVREIESQIKSVTDEFLDSARKLCKIASGGALTELDAHLDSTSTNGDGASKTEAEDDGYRSHPTSALLAVIPGAAKKKEKLLEIAPTVGHVQDLRQQASLEHKQFKEVLPRGCGEGFAQAVDDVVCEFIARWMRQRNSPTNFADNLVAEIRIAAKNNGWTRDDCEIKGSENEFVKAGFAAFNEGRPHTDVSQDNEANAKQWMTGWVGGEVLKSL
jgi:hypothetical protein